MPTRILIVEDDPDDVELLLAQLRRAELDKQVTVISDGARALSYLLDAQSQADGLIAVFLDLKLPSVPGMKILETIREQERIRHLPVVLMTSCNSEEDLERCRKLGVSAYVRKPITISAFTKAVADTFHVRRPSTASLPAAI